jgi:uncharacterized protein (TIGR03435 family)
MLRTLCCAALLPVLACAQTETKPAFEIADVHPSPPSRIPVMLGPLLRNGRYEIRHATMVDLIRTAWSIDAIRVVGGPNWLEDDTFDVIAKVPTGTTLETTKPMLQSLLAERFQLAVHNNTKPVLAYALKAGKRPQLKPAGESEGPGGCQFTFPPLPPPPTPGSPPPRPLFTFACTNMTMAAFAEALHTTIFAASQYLNDRVVVDATELKGAWDFDLKITPRLIGPAGPIGGSITLLEALDKLGLRLDPVEAPLPVIVVDKVNEKATPNSPNVAEALHEASPTEFEVAEIKPAAPDARMRGIQIQPGGRINVSGMPLKFLIEQAWNVSDDTLIGAPDWMQTDRYDIIAKADLGTAVDIDTMWTLLRSLLIERFKLVAHTDERPATAYTLIAVKPKMQKSDPATRTKCKDGPGPDGKDPRDKNPALSRVYNCQGITMAQFADRLKTLAQDYIHSPVLDSTGLEGRYDFTLAFSFVGVLQMAGRSGRGAEPGQLAPPLADPSAAASDPNGAMTLFEAIEKELGLKLEAQKRPVPVLVIDHVERKPIEN